MDSRTPPAATGLPRPQLCIFDLDGTLIDSLRDIAEALNECLELLGIPQQPFDDYRYQVGEGVPTLCARAIGQTHPHLLKRLIELARPRYRARPMRHTRPYAGVPELVRSLSQDGIKLAVLSNKPDDMTRRIVRQFWPDGEFEWVQGYVEERFRKPDPHHVHELCAAAGVEARHACMIGDTPTDVLTARVAGCRCIAVTWGFRTRADLQQAGAEFIVDNPAQVLSLIRGAAAGVP
jgi:phosphoglycolate phosphatase